jgi:ABC-type nitrate/sulfonate/bicarbonate transport system substrate-binding protein
MVARFVAAGGQFFPNEPVISVSDDFGDSRFLVETAMRIVSSATLSLAINADAYPKMSGSVVAAVMKTPEFLATLPDPVVTIAQQWPTRFWDAVPTSAIFSSGQATSPEG